MRSILATLLLLLAGHMLVSAQNMITIKGTVKGDLKGLKKVYIFGNEDKKDSVNIENGSFELNIPFVKPFNPMLYTEYGKKTKGRLDLFEIAVDKPGTIYIKDVNIEEGLYSGKISGLKSAVDFNEYERDRMLLGLELQKELRKKYGDSITRKSPNYTAYFTESRETYSLRQGVALQRFLKKNPGTYLSGYLLYKFRTFMNIGELEKNYKQLSKNFKESQTGKELADYISGARKTGIGQIVSDFTLNDPNDQPISFSQLKGKYVLIDFWASWCHPCIAAFPHMKELYKKYKGNNLEFYSISIDNSKSAWLNELKKHDMPWLQAQDTKSLSLATFAVTVVPTTILIDPEGKIILKENGAGPSGNGFLEKKLIELFGDK